MVQQLCSAYQTDIEGDADGAVIRRTSMRAAMTVGDNSYVPSRNKRKPQTYSNCKRTQCDGTDPGSMTSRVPVHLLLLNAIISSQDIILAFGYGFLVQFYIMITMLHTNSGVIFWKHYWHDQPDRSIEHIGTDLFLGKDMESL
ncbi:hypothetical protein DFJ58DRAFT_844416 [Suillus subalutaceus]|uniref:uncharacterized protein n=1 Tax=Suillus subalutaceus TaxID=48586 RepID=UPI001B87466B|nr:uncharacterized protein DFJ58DRAFT_844416 [Suillus subalutaceus]KAG1843309.1 hypothetical protein DFJ58DRAFT_844416 [Suillus subalutaceus]